MTAAPLPRRLAHALDLLNFTLADVRDGLGPYLSVYLLVTHHWDQGSIGLVMAIGGIAAVVAQTPVGALVDRTPPKGHCWSSVPWRSRPRPWRCHFSRASTASLPCSC